ncbi:hypothetical protein EVAR_49125_1 [Eumeta japonica]|uniref:Uncharacterized protein n=1 Tax=Eumeta variegata TaxID=151549 RepID=A0A4C1YKV7_EUMVA|nr:hypothetical protein EVAR_49125_1 [Eumeta japonica]
MREYVDGSKPIPDLVQGKNENMEARNQWIKADRKAKSGLILAISSMELKDHVNKFSKIVGRLTAMDIGVNQDLLSIMLSYSLPDSYEGYRCAIESRDEQFNVEALRVKIFEKSKIGLQSVVEVAKSAGSENKSNNNNFLEDIVINVERKHTSHQIVR